MDSDTYYMPITIKQMADLLHNYISNPDIDLSGEELVVGARYIHDEEDDVLPPQSIVLTLKRSVIDPDDSEYGILCIGPEYPKIVM